MFKRTRKIKKNKENEAKRNVPFASQVGGKE
jgi:hypothetical protein